jgi:YebC/PmpR family DNA-binding regulatory protein
MAGHSHWANIKHKKGANDAKKAAVITKMGKLITVAVQLGGPEIDMNPRLRLAISKARAQNMSMDAIDRAIKKAAGIGGDAKTIEELIYEGYAQQGVAVVVEALTDNRNRTASELRKLFDRAGGSLGSPGCVAWQFHQRAVFRIADTDEDRVLEVLLAADADADDIVTVDHCVEITAAPEQYDIIRDAIEAHGLRLERSDLTKLSENHIEVADLETAQRIQKFLDLLDDLEDVQAVYTNFSPVAAIATQL